MDYELDDDPERVQPDRVWEWLSTLAYWGRWRSRADFDAQRRTAWRVVGAYRRDGGEQVAFARAVSDGVAFAYLADVIVDPACRHAGVGRAVTARMIDEGPGTAFRWMLFTNDAHGMYEKFGFGPADDTVMIRPAAPNRR